MSLSLKNLQRLGKVRGRGKKEVRKAVVRVVKAARKERNGIGCTRGSVFAVALERKPIAVHPTSQDQQDSQCISGIR